jgi:hypothetical protein
MAGKVGYSRFLPSDCAAALLYCPKYHRKSIMVE